MIVWLNGALLKSAEARIDPLDRGFTLGDGLFETVAARGGKVLRIPAHLARLRQGCEILGLPYPAIDLEVALGKTFAANKLTDAVLRLTLTRGSAPRGLWPSGKSEPTLLITAEAMPAAPAPARCVIVTVTCRNQHSPLTRIKSVNYLDNILARKEAVERNADAAILPNTAGFIAESDAANVFIVKNGKAFTPPIADGALPGVMRAAILETGFASEKSLKPEDLSVADGVFLTNSLGIRLVTNINGTPINATANTFISGLKTKLVET